MLRNHPIMQQFNQLMNGKNSFEEKKEAVFQFGEKWVIQEKIWKNF